jgi:DNA-binding GntR family transcriptional regulator
VEKPKQAARKHDSDGFYRQVLEFHKEVWACAGNPFLTKALSQITVPLFAFWTLRHLRESDVDLLKQAAAHERIAAAIISQSKSQTRKVTREAMQGFWKDGARVARA